MWKCVVPVIYVGFRSEAKVIMEGDARSNSSFSYDDIDDVAQARPLNTQAATAGASGQNYFHEGVLHQRAGKFCARFGHILFTLKHQHKFSDGQ